MFYAFLANGFEEIEALATVDILRRADINVTTLGIGEKIVVGSHGIGVVSDMVAHADLLDERLEGIILPGGMPGTINLEKSEIVQKAIDFCTKNDKIICAICAAPSILGHIGLLKDVRFTCYPNEENVTFGSKNSQQCVEMDKNIITAKGAGASIEFGLKIIECVKGIKTAQTVRKKLQCP